MQGKSKQEEEGWLANTVKMGTDLQEDARSNFEKQWKQGLMGVEQLSPVSVLSEQTKASHVLCQQSHCIHMRCEHSDAHAIVPGAVVVCCQG